MVMNKKLLNKQFVEKGGVVYRKKSQNMADTLQYRVEDNRAKSQGTQVTNRTKKLLGKDQLQPVRK